MRFCTLLFFACFSVFAQEKITVDAIFSGAFREKAMDDLQSMPKSNQYTVNSGTAIELFDFATLKKVATVIQTKDFKDLPAIDSYTFSSDEQLMLLATNQNPIYRHSFTADYFLYNISTKSLTKLFDFQIQEPTISPDGKKIAYAKDNNLFVYDIAAKSSVQITTDGKKNAIINGITDWVYEEEFAFVKAFDWNADGTQIAYIRFDETDVPEFSMNVFGKDLYPTTETFKYPKAGEKNALVSLHLYNVATKAATAINLDNYTDFYIPRIKWTNDANLLSVQVLNRHQDNLDLLFVDAAKGQAKVIFNQKDKAYVDVSDKEITFMKNNSFIWESEKDGFNHLYLYDRNGKLVNQITAGKWEVTDYYGYDEVTNTIFYQSVENGSINRDIYSISLNGKNKKRLSTQTGSNSATFSPNFQYFINTFSNANQPTSYTLNEAKTGKVIQTILTNDAL